MRTLEARIGAALFIRTTRSVGLSEAGERFLSRAKPAFEELTAAAQAAPTWGEAAGLLAPDRAARGGADPAGAAAASFARAYPEIELEISTNEKLVDLAAEGFDAGIRLGQFLDADMIAVRLSPPFPLIVVGSPDYSNSASGPKASRICAAMPVCACGANGTIAPWTFASGNKRWRWPYQAPSSPTIFPPCWARQPGPGPWCRCPRPSPPG